MNAVKSTVDYCLFTLGFIVAVQLPEFIQQYKQYLVGKLSENQWHIDGYQKIADQSYGGDIKVLINEYLKNDKTAFQQTGQLVADLQQRHEFLSNAISKLETPSYIHQVINFIQYLTLEDVKTVSSYYQLAVPISIEAMSSGLILGFVFVWLRVLLSTLLGRLVGIPARY